MALELPVCAACGHAVFPPRLACPRCHSDRWQAEPAGAGTIEQVTTVRRSAVITAGGQPVWLALVRTELGPRVIARLAAAVSPGQRVELAADGDAITAKPAN